MNNFAPSGMQIINHFINLIDFKQNCGFELFYRRDH